MIPLKQTSFRARNHFWPILIGSTLAVLMLSSCRRDANHDETSDSSNTAAMAWADSVLNSMTLPEQVAQMIVVGMPDLVDGFNPESFESLLARTVDFGAGGIVFLKTDPLPQSAITADLQSRSEIPMFVAQDMEWGAAMRVQHAIEYPQAMGIGATNNPEFARLAGQHTAEEARALGVNMVLAPVADVNSNPDNPIIATRSFGDVPETVASFVSQFVSGVQSEGLLATSKHFPGHGSTDRDSHATLPRVAPERFRTGLLDLMPFVASIEVNVAAIMTGHLAIADETATNPLPATLSDSLLTTVLREKMGFQGLIISDALNMAGVGTAAEANSVTIKAVNAGVNLLLMPSNPIQTRETILRAVADGSINIERITSSVRRILETKWRFGLSVTPAPRIQDVRTALTGSGRRGFIRQLAHHSIVLVDKLGIVDSILPLESVSVSVIPIVDSTTGQSLEYLRKSLERYASNLTILDPVVPSTSISTISNSLSEAARSDLILIADLSSVRGSRVGTINRIADAAEKSNQVIVFLAMGSPYNFRGIISDTVATFFSFGSAPYVIDAVVDAVFGRSKICGKLPVHVNVSYPRGAGICREQMYPREGLPEEVGMSSTTMRELKRTIEKAIADSAFPGAALAVGRSGVISKLQGFGHFTYERGRTVDPNSVFDLASLTKVIATTTAIMQLYEDGRIRLDDTIASILPDFNSVGKDAVTIRHLLTHTGGLIPFRPYFRDRQVSRVSVIENIMNDSLVTEPGFQSRYSDLGPILLALVVEKLSGKPFDEYSRDHIFQPLRMYNTGYRSVRRARDAEEIIPTELDTYFRNRLVQGVVHDETAYVMGGVAGHAGLFSTVNDLALFADMMLNNGRTGGEQFLKPETIRLFTGAVDPGGLHTRALGWDTKSMRGYSSAGSHFGRFSFGHTGFTGTSLWIDPDHDIYVILLTNRVYPTRDNSKHVAVRPAIADIAFEAIQNASDQYPSSLPLE